MEESVLQETAQDWKTSNMGTAYVASPESPIKQRIDPDQDSHNSEEERRQDAMDQLYSYKHKYWPNA